MPAAAYDSLPVFDHHHGSPAEWPGLRVAGLVRRPILLTAAALAALPRRDLVDDFRCVEGWTVPGQRWQGVPLSCLLARAGPLPNARYAAVSAAGFTVAIPLDNIGDDILLATRLNGADLPPEHGGPCRLVGPGQACYASVKWVDTIALADIMAAPTARAIALARRAPAVAPVSASPAP